MNRTVLLVNPWVYDFAAYDFWSKPLGLLYIASMLRQSGFSIVMIDCMDRHRDAAGSLPVPPPKGSRRPRKKCGRGHYRREITKKPAIFSFLPRHYARYGLAEKSFVDALREIEKPDVIFVTSAMTYWYPGVVATIRILKALVPGVPIVLGGTYATLCPDHAESHSGADTVLPGRFEAQDGDRWAESLGAPLEFPPSLKDWPFPAWDLYSILPYAVIMTSRGCPFACTYCAGHLLYPGFEQRDPEDVLAEFRELYNRFHVRHFAFYDDAIMVDPSTHLLPFLEGVAEMKARATFHTPNGLHAGTISRELAEGLFLAGFRTMRLSLESADPHRQRVTGGKIGNEDFLHTLDNMRAGGFRAMDLEVYIMIGLPDQTMEEVLRSIFYVYHHGVRVKLVQYSPIPGTVEWDRHIAAGGHPALEEPLWHNNSVFLHTLDEFPYDTFQKLKNLIRLLDEGLRRGVNLLERAPFQARARKIMAEFGFSD